MIIDEDYLISRFYLKSGKVLSNSLYHKDGIFNYYDINEGESNIKLLDRQKEIDEGEDYVIEKLVGIISLDGIEFVETEEIEKIEKSMLEIIDIVETENGENVENRDSY